jgi:hypothetical protein
VKQLAVGSWQLAAKDTKATGQSERFARLLSSSWLKGPALS